MTTTVLEPTQAHSNTRDLHKCDYNSLTPYVHPPMTEAILPWAELVTLDLEDYDRPGGKECLASQLEHAIHHVGFFYVKNYGLTDEQVQQQFTLVKTFFELPVSEKEKYEVDYAAAEYNGWRRPGSRLQSKVKDNVEIYNFAKFTPDFEGKYNLPDLLQAHLPEIEYFHRTLHSNVVLPLLRLFAIILQLPDEDSLVKQHTYEKKVKITSVT